MNMNAMMLQAKKMQAEMDLKQKALEKQEFTIKKQGISIVMKGDRKLLSVSVNDALVDPDDVETLEDMIIITVNEAIDTIDQAHAALTPQSPNGLPF